MQTNFMGYVHAIHTALQLLQHHSVSQPVSIIIMASLLPPCSSCMATKHVLRSLAEGLRFEILLYNIRVSLICPSFTRTLFLDNAVDKDHGLKQVMRWVHMFSKRWAETPKEVACYTISAIKRGSFLVTTRWHPMTFVLCVLGRGVVFADSLARVVLELVLLLPSR
ncbi:hypothetical protein L7F22_043493 [Adiantum nelumboides]|nr:hypothetical protein [Adiantum nelumboides]